LQQIGGAVMVSASQSWSSPSITARPSVEEKRMFAALAATQRISESQLALNAIRILLRQNFPNGLPCDTPLPAHDPGTDRITIRLRPGDLRAIATRAAVRHTKPSTYLAALVRGHIARNPPLAVAELEAFKKALVVLTGCAILTQRALRSAPEDATEWSEVSRKLVGLHAAVAVLEERMHDVVYKSLRSWESNYG
jgi:hypothetical protein